MSGEFQYHFSDIQNTIFFQIYFLAFFALGFYDNFQVFWIHSKLELFQVYLPKNLKIWIIYGEIFYLQKQPLSQNSSTRFSSRRRRGVASLVMLHIVLKQKLPRGCSICLISPYFVSFISFYFKAKCLNFEISTSKKIEKGSRCEK